MPSDEAEPKYIVIRTQELTEHSVLLQIVLILEWGQILEEKNYVTLNVFDFIWLKKKKPTGCGEKENQPSGFINGVDISTSRFVIRVQLKPERWGSQLVQEEKYHGEKTPKKREKLNNYNVINQCATITCIFNITSPIHVSILSKGETKSSPHFHFE